MSFYGLSPDVVINLPEDDKKTINELIERGLKDGVVKPLPRIVVTVTDVQERLE